MLLDKLLHGRVLQKGGQVDATWTFSRGVLISGLGDRVASLRFLGCWSFCGFRVAIKVTVLIVLIVFEALDVKVFTCKAFKTCMSDLDAKPTSAILTPMGSNLSTTNNEKDAVNHDLTHLDPAVNTWKRRLRKIIILDAHTAYNCFA